MEVQPDTGPHYFGLWGSYKKRSGQVISRRKATLWKTWFHDLHKSIIILWIWMDTECCHSPRLRSHLACVTCPTVSQITSGLSRVATKIFEDFHAAQTVIATTAHWGITVNLGSWFLSLLLWQIDSPISKVSHGALLTYSSFCQALCPFCVHVSKDLRKDLIK